MSGVRLQQWRWPSRARRNSTFTEDAGLALTATSSDAELGRATRAFTVGKRLTLPTTFGAEPVVANLAYAQYVISTAFGEGCKRATADAGPALRPPLCAKSQGPAHVAEKPDYFFFLNTSTIPPSPSTRTKSPVSITSVGSLSKSVMAGTSIFMAANTVRLLPLV